MIITEAQRRQLDVYLDELYRWNQRINLTAVARGQAWSKHVEESLQLLDLPIFGEIGPSIQSLADIGSGGGIPGVVLAIIHSPIRVVLIEADQRKAAFLNHICGQLNLTRAEVVIERVENMGQDTKWRETFDLVVSRATAEPPVLVELALPLLKIGGSLVAMVSDAFQEVSNASYAAQICGGSLPVAVNNRHLSISKQKLTPSKFPRRAGLPRQKPLVESKVN